MLASGASEPVAGFTNPYLFVVGAARSGTTLLARMLDSHRLLAVVDETYWLPRRSHESMGLIRGGMVTEALLPVLLAHPRFARTGVSEEELRRLFLEEQPLRYEDFVARIFDRCAARAGKPFAGDKTPGYVRKVEQMHELCPRARFIHIIRDPRDICLSMLDWRSGERTVGRYGTWKLDPAVSTALYWRYSVALGREAGTKLGPRSYCEVRYEDLVARPRYELERICAFLHLPYDDAMSRYHEGKTRPAKPGRSSKARWLPPMLGLRDWQTQLPRGDAQRIELAAKDLLGQFGYERRFDTADVTAREHTARVFDVFTAGMLRHGRVLPSDWTL